MTTGPLRRPLIILFCFLSCTAFCQERVEREYEKGYVQDGRKVLMWEYLDENKQPALAINHTTGRVFYLKPDSSDFVILKNGNWVAQSLRIYPIPIEGYYNYYQALARTIRYSTAARGDVLVMFEVDTLGKPGNYSILKDIGDNCGNEVIRILKENQTEWLPAREGGKTYRSRFVLRVFFGAQPTAKHTKKYPDTPMAHRLKYLAVDPYGLVSYVMGFDQKEVAGSINVHQSIERFNSIEDAIRSGKKVVRLSLPNRSISVIPSNIGLLKRLKVLDLEQNGLTSIATEISDLKDLEELYLPLNKLNNVPDEIGMIKSLRIVAMASNEFKVFPKELCACKNLQQLDLASNQITAVPACIGELRNLRLIALQHNNIQSLPDEFFNLKNLETIYLSNNPLDQETIEKLKTEFKNARIVLE